MEREDTGVLRRVLDDAGGADLLDVLADRLSGADLTSLLLEAMRRRADRLSPADVLRQYRTDRFVSPAGTDVRDLRRVEHAMFGALPDGFDVLTLAPVLPLGAHSALAAVDPRNVIATIRRTDQRLRPRPPGDHDPLIRTRGRLGSVIDIRRQDSMILGLLC